MVVARASGGLVVPAVVGGFGDESRMSCVERRPGSDRAGLVAPEGAYGIDDVQTGQCDVWSTRSQMPVEGPPIMLRNSCMFREFRRTSGDDPPDDDTLAFMMDPVWWRPTPCTTTSNPCIGRPLRM